MIEGLAFAMLESARLPLVSEEALVERGGSMPLWRQVLARWMFTTPVRLNFYRALAVYRAQEIREGAALVNWWNVITSRGSKHRFHPLAILIPVLLHAMHYRGMRWQSLFRAWVPINDAMIITASEQAGLTPGLLQTLMDLSLAQRQWNKKLRAAALPALVNLVWLVGLLAGVGLFYFPALQRSMPRMRLVGDVATLAHFSSSIGAYGWAALLLLLATPLLVQLMLRRLTGPVRALFDSLPGFSLYRQATGMTFLLGISALLDVGESFPDAVRVLRKTASPYVAERLDAILAFDNLRPADAMVASGFHWPDDATLELLSLYMVTRAPQDGIRVIVDDWFDRAGDSYARIAATVNSLGQLLTWGIVGWLYLVTSQLTATMAH
jgi:hypothetical protein